MNAISKLRIHVRLLLAVLLSCLWASTAQAWWNGDWAYRKQLNLDAGPAGAALPGEVKNAVVLVRLHEGVFKFSDANADGSDLRFVAEDDKTELAHHVEKYDPVFNLAFVWVQLPLLANGKPAPVWMYYGNAKATVASDSKNSYDPSQLLVYHFGEKGAPAVDATAFKHDALTAAAINESGLIGNSARFDGASVLDLPTSPSLQLTAGGAFSWSVWVQTKNPNGVVLSQADAAGNSLHLGLDGSIPYLDVTGAGGTPQTVRAAAGIDENWHQLTVTGGGELTLYVDGSKVASLPYPTPAIAAAPVLGGEGPTGQAGRGSFVGELDELQIAKVARSGAEIRLAAINQGSADKLVSFGVDEGQAGGGTSYFAIILKSLTVDAWVCMIVLFLMMCASFYIMYRKGRQIGAATKGNRLFMQLYEEHAGDLVTMHQALEHPTGNSSTLAEDDMQRVQASPLNRMFRIGSHELNRRMLKNTRGILSEQSIEAIRASLHGSFIREQQELNRLMVLLTIAISGGPFIGLLGTVLGVMITFAAVAAAGDVNVNAIAPGISAALAATVTGLFVAIPSLFGYNYLLTRVKECSADMQVFVDAFITSIAENYNDPGVLDALAA